MIPTSHVLILSAVLFATGVLGVMLRRNVIVIFMSIEVMLNAVNLSFVAFAREMDSMAGGHFYFLYRRRCCRGSGRGIIHHPFYLPQSTNTQRG